MILVAGSANLDFVVRAEHIPAPGETVLGHSLATFPGGKGANQAVAAARAGGSATHMLLALGQDDHALVLEASLRAAGVHMHVVRSRTQQASGTAFICVSRRGENAITVAPGANMELAAHDLPPLEGFGHLLMQLEIPLDAVRAYARAARSAGVKVVLNAAPAAALDGELMGLVDVLVVNQGELMHISSGAASIAAALERLPVPLVVVTLGARGCCARTPTGWVLQPAFAVAPIDTTGAGDTFCGVLVAALDQGTPVSQALRLANAAAALACTRVGAQTSVPERGEVARFLMDQAPADAEALARLRDYCASTG